MDQHQTDQTSSSTNLFNKSGISFVNVFNESKHENYQFKTPKQAPVYRPTKEEFELGPLNYIAKIREEAEQFGICKIIPPSCFQPPFTLDVNNFRFTPRIQRLNELEAQTRVRLCFLEKLIKYWSLQSHQIKIPSIDKQVLDLYKLHKVVDEEGGFDTCSQDRKWSIVACKMGFNCTPQNKGTIASLLRHHYEKILYPYDLFVNGVTYDESTLDELKVTLNNENCKEDSIDDQTTKESKQIKEEPSDESSLNNSEIDKMDIDETKNNSENENDKPTIRRSSRRMQGQSLCNVKLENSNKELARLQVFSPGPKMSGFSPTDEEKNRKHADKSSSNECVQCGENSNQSQSIQCSTCKNNFHIKCLIPPLKATSEAKNEWNCPRCIAYLIQTQPQSYDTSFGFVQSQRTYSIAEFGEIADQFKSDYFNKPCHATSWPLTEKEFWRLISSYDEQDAVTVEYGADLHTNDFGSGFPTHRNPKLLPADLEYVDHAWNLNNLPVLEGSVFKYINTNISGMVVPWNYIGMCFSTFCWHNEDHWSYSINYLHWGEQKCWYGVPGEEAEKFEEAMKSVAPELFKSQPDLLHQLVTICNPNVLEDLGVPVCTTNQKAGEFIITFPRAYHTGFNHGLNFAEAVNFAPSDWLKIGRQCIDNYSMLKRYPVFSHDELVCKMANDPDILDISLAEATYLDLIEMVEQEKLKRQNVLDMGIRKSVRETFELLQDDERQCDYCKTTCFLSAINCDCSDCKLVCLKHADKLCMNCKFEDMTLRYRYTLDELPLMLEKMNKRKSEYQSWLNKVKCFFEPKSQDTSTTASASNHQSSSVDKVFSLTEFKAHLNEVNMKNYPKDNEIYLKMKETIDHATKLSKVAKDILEQQKILDDINEQIAKSNRLKNDHLRKSYQKQAKKPVDESIVLRSSTKSKKSKDQDDEERTKLEFDEFKEFVEEINRLPCTIPESDLINQLYNRCDTIKKSIEEITSYTKEESEDLSSDFIDQLIFEANCISIVDFDDKLDIVKYKLDEIRWIEKCKLFLNNQDDSRKKKHQIELTTLDTMIDLSKELLVSTNISQELILQLLDLKEKAETWISKTKKLVDLPEQTQLENGEFDINLYDKLPVYDEVESLVKEVEEDNDLVRVNLSPHLEKVQNILTNATDWLCSYEKLLPTDNQSNESLPFFDQIEELFNSGIQIGCKMNQMCKLYSTFKLFKSWREKLVKLFMKKNSIYNLFSVLLPRTNSSLPQSVDLVNMSSKVLYLQLKKIYCQQSAKDQNKIDWFKKQLDSKLTRESIEKVYKEAILNEEVCMKQIKEKNLIKLHSVTDNDSASRLQDKSTDFETEDDICDKNFDLKKKKFCICGKKPLDWMIQCVLCQEYFHAKNCLKMKKTTQVNQLNNGNTGDNSTQENLDRDNSFFVCLLCNRGKRPNLDLVINLSDQISNQKVRIMENELLLCIISRANKFRYDLQKELNTRSDLKEAYNLVVKAFNGLMDGNSVATNSGPTSTNLDNEALIKKKKIGHQQNKIKDLKINLSDQTKNVLQNLIWDCSLLQVNLVEFRYLWEIYCQANPDFKTSIYITETANFTLPITENYIQYKQSEANANAISNNGDKKRKIEQSSKSTNLKSKKSKAQKSNQNGKSKSSDSGSESEICDLNENCLRPKSKNVDWVFCEGCKSWLHFLCCGIDSTDEIDKVKEFYCSKCLSEKESSKSEDELNRKSENSSLQAIEESSKEPKVNEMSEMEKIESEAAKSILSLSNLGLDIVHQVNQQPSSQQNQTESTLAE